MPRSSGTFTAPSSSVNPAVEGTTIDETDFNALIDDIESALTESVYTGGLGSTDNQLIRTDGTDTKKVQGTGITVDDSNNVSGIAALTVTTINVGNSDTTIARTGAGDISIEGNAIYRAGGTDVPIADGGTGASTATAAFNALSPTTTQGDIIYHNGTNNVRLGAGTAGQVLQTGGAGANPSWTNAGAGDVAGQSSSVDDEIALFSGTGGKTIKRATTTGILKATSGVIAAASQGTDYYAPSGTDVAIADGGTGASTAAAGARALLEGLGSTQGDILYRNGTQWTALGTGTVGQVLQAGGAGANPSWATVAGTGDVTAASSFGTDNRLIRSDGTGKGVQASGITVDDSDNVTGAANLVTASSFGTDNRLIRSDGTGKGVQASGITVDDSDNVTGAANLVTLTGSQTLTNKTLTSPTITSPTITSPTITAPVGVDSINSGPLAGLRNRIINGSMRIWQRDTASVADDVYGFDRWNNLAQTAATTLSQITLVENTTPHMMRITQGQASAQRVGTCQILEYANSVDLRGQGVILSARVRCSNSTTLRYAILEWTGGTPDSVTSDVVNDWTSANYTPGASNFFPASNITVSALGSNALTANTLTSISLTGTLGSSFNNVIVLFWTDSTQAQNSTLDIGKVQLEIGDTATTFERIPYSLEFSNCARYYLRVTDWSFGAYNSAGGGAYASATLPTEMRISPTGAKIGTWNAVNCGQPSISSTGKRSFSVVTVVTATGAFLCSTDSSDDGFTFDAEL
jgi:hypothetical protein